jgi:hypothetical protein
VVEIWDVRRGAIAKWTFGAHAAEGGLTGQLEPTFSLTNQADERADIVWGASAGDVLWGQHASGTFAQLDVNSIHARVPLSAVPRAALAWTPGSALAFAFDHQRTFTTEIPFDDALAGTPLADPSLALLDVPLRPRKAIGAKAYVPGNQSVGVVPLEHEEDEKRAAFRTLAQTYALPIHGTGKQELCEKNVEVHICIKCKGNLFMKPHRQRLGPATSQPPTRGPSLSRYLKILFLAFLRLSHRLLLQRSRTPSRHPQLFRPCSILLSRRRFV